ncbi:hypothetical protein B0T25DRAFT_627541 [Lasiosphaeria hispida]|uniref:Fucose-specific lectin n=1 Tax=Lasiosphaeria hispida TaxID=260671 RepID=A0AAJ0HVA7_9PEZI|nr:hypothetical protein B0T25DRAFT_627541 [Lasiosphaeria hispida]
MASKISAALLLLAAAVSPCQAAIAAWWNGIGPQIILQNTTTDAIRHSTCNAFNTPFYSPTDGSELSLYYKPKTGTPLAGTGYWNELTTIASVFYVNNNNGLCNALFECNMATGLFKSQGNWVISDGAPSVHNNTGLSVVLLGATGGYRVYYHDEDMLISEIGYTQDSGWEYRGIISHDPQISPAIGAAFTGKENITIVNARDEQNMEAARYYQDETWRITTFPHPLEGDLTTQDTNATSIALNETAATNFTLNAYAGTPKSLAVTIDSAYTRSVWYIGNDSTLYSAANKNWVWGKQANQSNAFWPQADTPNAEFGVASEFKSSMVRIYYFVKGSLAEIKYENGAWKAWAAVSTPEAAVTNEPPSSPIPTSTATSSTSATAAAAAAGTTGLSSGAKAGVGVGVTLGVLALGAIGAAFFVIRRKRNNMEPAAATLDPDTPVPPYGELANPQPGAAEYDNYMWDKKDSPPVPQYAPNYAAHQLDAPVRPMEMEAPRPMYELPGQTYSHELVGDGHRHQAP